MLLGTSHAAGVAEAADAIPALRAESLAAGMSTLSRYL